MYAGDENGADTPIVIPDGNQGPTDSNGNTEGWERRLQILGERAKPTAQALCEEIVPDMLAFTKEASSGGTEAYMVEAKNIQATGDFRKTFPFPEPGQKVVFLQCRATIDYSINVEAETDYYLMIDSDGNTRLRYYPDNSTSRKTS
jgi:hypothetical protein